MPQNISKTGIENLDEVKLHRVLQGDGTFHYFALAGYNVTTDEGLVIPRGKRYGPLGGARRTAVVNIFSSIDADIRSDEGLP